MNIYINLIEYNKCFHTLIWAELKDWKDFISKIKIFLKENIKNEDNKDIYLFVKNIFKIDWKIIKQIDNIKFIYTDNFAYALKQLSLLSQVSEKDVVITNNDWDYYLHEFLNVYSIDYKNLKCEMKKIDEKYLKVLYPGVKREYLLDYLILQVKNEDNSIWHKKTLYYLEKYKGISKLLENIENIKEEKYKELFFYQRERLKFYLILKNLFLTKDDICFTK